MDSDVLLLAQLVIEYTENGNAAGEYDGKDPRLLGGHPGIEGNWAEDILRQLAYKVKQQEETK